MDLNSKNLSFKYSHVTGKTSLMELEDDRKSVEIRNVCCLGTIPKRLILYLLTLTAMICMFIMRSVMPITLLAMVKDHPPDRQNITNGYNNKTCFHQWVNNTKTIQTDYGGTFEWSINIQYYILTSFFWTYIAAQVLGGVASQKWGSKVVVGYGFLISSLCHICVPFASYAHYLLVIILQIVQGLSQGVVWPSLYGLISSWIPVSERSRYVTSFQGLAIGATIGHVMAGFVIARFKWEYVFFISGGLGLLWSLIWYFLAHDTPELHPCITYQELQYIKKTKDFVNNKRKRKIPWKSILFSLPIWAISITSFGRMWLNVTISMYGPFYLKTIIGLDVESNGLWSGLPSTACLFSSFFFSYLSDKISSRNYISLINNRKLFCGISQVIPGILAICFGYLNCNISLILSVWCLLYIIPTASFASSMVNVLDVSPNFAGPAIGFIQIFLMLPTILASKVAKTFIEYENTLTAWQSIFNIAGVVNIISYGVYFFFASSQVQEWDKIDNVIQTETKFLEK